MTDKLTTEERMTLAEYCGRTFYLDGSEIFLTTSAEEMLPLGVWQPDVDASQRDEVEAVLVRQVNIVTVKTRVVVATSSKLTVLTCVQLDNLPCDHALLDEYETRGLAVCRAALELIVEEANAELQAENAQT